MKRGKFWILVSALLAIAMVLAACSGGTTTKTTTIVTGSVSQPTGTTSAVPTTAATTTAPTTAATTSNKPVRGGTYKYAAPAWVSSMNVLLAGQAQDGYFQAFAHYILGQDTSQKVVPYAGESWEWQDQTTFILHLRKDVKFTDGSPFNADSVVYTYEWGKNPDNKALWMSFYKTVTATKIDNYTVQFKTASPVNWPAQLTNYGGSMLSKATMDQWGADYTKHPSGIGAFKLTDLVVGSSAVFARADDFFMKDEYGTQLPYLDTVRVVVIPDQAVQLAALKAGQLDICSPPYQDVANLKNDPRFTVYSGASSTIWSIMLNNQVKPMDDVRVRRAISLAIDRQAIIDGLYFGFGRACASLYPPELWYHNPALTVPARDLVKAKQLLADAGYPTGFNMLMLCLNDTLTVARSQAIQAQLAEINITVTVEPMEPASAMARRNKKDWAAVNHNWTNITDPQVPLDGWFLPEAAYGFGAMLYDDVIPLIRQSATEFTDQTARQQLYWTIEQKLYDDMAQVWYMSPNGVACARKDLRGYGIALGSEGYPIYKYWFAK